uniref:Phosphatidate cytidylyltransferase n=1 Tax=Octactis speculum TaxID=3111310 RepID=A0A7S2HB53_9STRA
MATGVYPARRICVVATIIMYLCACKFAALHELVLPLAACAVMVWFLIMRRQPASISEVSSSFMGIFYVGYMPSFWVRLRSLSNLPIRTIGVPAFLSALPADIWTQGAVIKWWVCFSIVCSDVAAYFAGKKFGMHHLSSLGRGAAGKTSPNKTIEGASAGILASTALSLLGAKAMQWPLWAITGPAFGVLLGLTAVVGDLTASMFKRDAGLKDYGDLLPGHGGVLDRFDSYILTGPLVYFFMSYILPLVAKAATG